ncbi:MAG: response regulator transcription factor [Synergistaceae bacterium]|jgi:two-component system response regulator CpxR|nr:response regulator transcription factor [Synergistaceae bacterium]
MNAEGGKKIRHILVIDDDVDLCALLKDYLQSEGFGFACAYLGSEGLKLLNSRAYDIVILDVMLPEQDGFDVLREIRSISNVPVVMLSAKGDQIDKVVGLEIGADDYICKPFDARELLARLKAVLRRSGDSKARPARNVDTLADLELCRESLSVKIAGADVYLTNVEFSLLDQLISCAGKKISSEQLSVNVLGRGYTSFDRSLSVHISRLRHKLGPYPDGRERIKTLRNEGYMYIYPQNDFTEETP